MSGSPDIIQAKLYELMKNSEESKVYLDWRKPFDGHTDASDYQLGSIIAQENKPKVFFFSRKINSSKKNYTSTEKELISIVETLK